MNKREKILVIVMLLLMIMAGVYFILRPSITFKKDMNVLEKDGQYLYLYFVEECDGDITVDERYLDASTVGKHTFVYTVKNRYFTRKVRYHYEVVDTTAPVISMTQSTVYKLPYEKYDIEDMERNVHVREGTLSFETNYDPAFCGEYYVKAHAEDEAGNKSDGIYSVIVQDKEAPVLFHNGNDTVVLKGESFDPKSVIVYGDNADPAPVLEIKGEVDTSKAGSYILYGSLTDYSGNKREWNFTVRVVEENTPYEPSDPVYYDFADFKKDYGKEGLRFGMDVSTWQGDIDYEKVKEAGCEFVIIRIGYSWLGELNLDTRFRDNLEGFKKAGMPLGIYLYSYDNNEADLLKALDSVFQELGDTELEYGISFDWEDFGAFTEYKMSFQMLNHLYDVFEEEVSNKGYKPVLYGSAYYLKNIWKNTEDTNVWIAHYTDKSDYNGQYEMWQRCSNGRIDGIEGYTDFDIFYDTKQ